MGITFGDSGQQISKGGHEGKGATEGEEESTWEDKGGGGVEPRRG